GGGEVLDRGEANRPAPVDRRRLCAEGEPVRQGGRLQVRGRLVGQFLRVGNGPGDDVDLLLREVGEEAGGNAEVFRQHLTGGGGGPGGDAEGAELVEEAVVEDEDKVALLVADVLDIVGIAARDVGQVAGAALDRLPLAAG